MKTLFLTLTLLTLGVACNKSPQEDLTQKQEEARVDYREEVNEAAEDRREDMRDAREDFQKEEARDLNHNRRHMDVDDN